MANKNGLALPQAFAAPSKPFYATAENPVIVAPTLVSAITLQAAEAEGVLAEPAKIYIDGTLSIDAAYVGAINLQPGGNTLAAPAAGITIRSAPGSAPPAPGTIVEIGANAEGPNHLYVAGASGVSEVYTALYNPVIKPVQVAGIVGSIPANTGPGLFTFTPTVSGAYMLQVNFNIANADDIPGNGIIEWTLNVGGGEVQYCSNTIKSTSISKASDFNYVNGVIGTLAEPVDYSFSNMAILTAGQQVSFYLAAAFASGGGGLPWVIANYQVRLMQMC